MNARTRKGTTYYPTPRVAWETLERLRDNGTCDNRARVVGYGYGYAVQARRSGPYWNAETERFQ